MAVSPSRGHRVVLLGMQYRWSQWAAKLSNGLSLKCGMGSTPVRYPCRLVTWGITKTSRFTLWRT